MPFFPAMVLGLDDANGVGGAGGTGSRIVLVFMHVAMCKLWGL